ncbi:MAG: hypothetical protein ACLQDQ_16120 [Myxococcaceae bacterium]
MKKAQGTAFAQQLSLTFLCALAGCGGGANPGVTVSPATAAVTAGDAGVTFTATLSGLSSTISWAVEGLGSINPSTGPDTLYRPPATVAAATSVLVAAEASGFEGVAEVLVSPPVPTLIVSPATVTVMADGGAVGFTATLVSATGVPEWILTGPGTISPGLGATTSYTPPASVVAETTAYLTAELASTSISGVAIITIEPP